MTRMNPTHTRTFCVRHYECDAYGHVNHANYLRYVQEAAFEASAAVGYDLGRYAAMGRQWWVRETEITYAQPLRFGDDVAVKTWVVDFRRVRSRRAYELRRVADAELVARAMTDWVFLDTESSRPETIPDEMVQAFLPAGPDEDVPPREPFPEPPPPPAGCFVQRRHVEWADLDPAGHVNNAVYLRYMEDAAIQDARARGWTMQRMVEEGNFGIIARRSRLQYVRPARMDDDLDVATWISDVRRTNAIRHYTVRRSDGTLLTRGRIRWVWVNLETGRPMRIPDSFATDFAANIVS